MAQREPSSTSRFPPLYASTPRRCCSRQTGAIVIDHYGYGVNPYTSPSNGSSSTNNDAHGGVNGFLLSFSSPMQLGRFLPMVLNKEDSAINKQEDRSAMYQSSSALASTLSQVQLRDAGSGSGVGATLRQSPTGASPRHVAHPLLREGRVVRRVRQRMASQHGHQQLDDGSGLAAFYSKRPHVPSLETSRGAQRGGAMSEVRLPDESVVEGLDGATRKLLAALDEVARRVELSATVSVDRSGDGEHVEDTRVNSDDEDNDAVSAKNASV